MNHYQLYELVDRLTIPVHNPAGLRRPVIAVEIYSLFSLFIYYFTAYFKIASLKFPFN